jgi:multimeric flavodoxin WrbA
MKKTKMNVIGVIASPRKEGNTAWIVNTILEGAAERGAETQSWSFSDLDIQPCQGCLYCHETSDRGCIINDDMQKLYVAIEQADAIVLGSPIYMGQMSAQAKTILDRLFAYISPRFSPFYKEKSVKKKLTLVFTQGNPHANMFQVYLEYTKSMFQLLEFDVQGVHVVAGMREEPAHEKKDLHTTMKNIGAALIPS